ncbi:hypothetical protein COO60DRAFT_1183292 [Scenedesmus sp. NREL 46B-D3]|nr:hypothetical protein COO60DRAFT_1183292 [Scenedesmus sp. NREL 46B-D3]
MRGRSHQASISSGIQPLYSLFGRTGACTSCAGAEGGLGRLSRCCKGFVQTIIVCARVQCSCPCQRVACAMSCCMHSTAQHAVRMSLLKQLARAPAAAASRRCNSLQRTSKKANYFQPGSRLRRVLVAKRTSSPAQHSIMCCLLCCLHACSSKHASQQSSLRDLNLRISFLCTHTNTSAGIAVHRSHFMNIHINACTSPCTLLLCARFKMNAQLPSCSCACSIIA